MGQRSTRGSKTLTGIAIGVLVLVLGLVLVWQVWFRDTETPVTVAEAIADFREEVAPVEVATAQPVTRQLPASGVYRYSTAGQETVSALGGTTHEYPTTTTMTVRPSACGVTYTWIALEERSELLQLCRGDDHSLAIAAYTSFHRFFGQDDRLHYTCEPAVVLLPPAPSVGSGSSAACTSAPLTETISASITALDVVEVGEELVDAVEVAISVELTAADDSASGTATAQLWLALDSGLILRWEERTSSVSDSAIGDVSYEETFRLELESLEPET